MERQKTPSGRDVILTELVGHVPALRDGIYTDSYICAINSLYPLQDVLGEKKAGILARNWGALLYFTMGTPLNNDEGEDVLRHILYRSANTNIWQPDIIDVSKLTDTRIQTAVEYLEHVGLTDPSSTMGKMDAGKIFGIARAQRGGFVFTTNLENKVIVVPSQTFIEYCLTQNAK